MADKSSSRPISNGQQKSTKSKPVAQSKTAVKSVVKPAQTFKTAQKLASDQIFEAQKSSQKIGEKVQKAFVKETEKFARSVDARQWFSGDLPESETLAALPEVFRVFAEQSLTQTRTAYEAAKESFEKAGDTLGNFAHNAGNNLKSIQIKTMDMALLNIDHYFDYARSMVTARNLSEIFEVQNAHISKQVDLVSSQLREWQDLSQDILANSTHQLQGQSDR